MILGVFVRPFVSDIGIAVAIPVRNRPFCQHFPQMLPRRLAQPRIALELEPRPQQIGHLNIGIRHQPPPERYPGDLGKILIRLAHPHLLREPRVGDAPAFGIDPGRLPPPLR